MDTNTDFWDKAEIKFKEWLDSSGTRGDDIPDKILNTSFLLSRKNLQKTISKLLKERSTSFGCDFFLAEESVPYTSAEESIDELYLSKVLESSIDLSETSEKSDVREVESAEQRNDRIVKAILTDESWPILELYENELPRLIYFLRKNSGTNENAKDIFQDGMVILIEKLYHNNLNLTAPIESYLYGICQKLWMNQLRKMKRKIPAIDDIVDAGQDINIDSTDDITIDKKINSIIESLGAPCRTLLEFYYYRNMGWDEIASQLGYASAESARNQKYKCLERIRKQVA